MHGFVYESLDSAYSSLGCIYPHGSDYLLYDDSPPDAEEKPWLRARAVPFPTYFDKIYKEISSLKLVPLPAAGNFGPAIGTSQDPEAKVSPTQSLMRPSAPFIVGFVMCVRF